MTLKLELSPELERRARADAAARRVPLETLAMAAIEAFVNSSQGTRHDADEATRLAEVDAGYGLFRGRGPSVDEFLAQRHAEGEADYHEWQASQFERDES